MIGYWEAVSRTETGPLTREEDYDRRISTVARRMAQTYAIRYDREQVVPSDDDLADRVYQAALELFVELGVYCRDTGRVARFTREEVEDALKFTPRSVTYGAGRDLAVMTYKGVEDATPPFTACTPVGCTVAEERFVAMVQSYAQEPLADTFSSAFSATVHGRVTKHGTPGEVEAAIWNVIKLREAARAAGRPLMGIHNLVSNAERCDATLAAIQPAFGVQPNDGLAIAAIAELKVDHERMRKTVFAQNLSMNTYGLYGPLMGGYAGGPETTAIVAVAYAFLGVMLLGVRWHDYFPLHLIQGCNSTRELLWLISVLGQALSRNTRLLKALSPFSAAGPCTEMVVYEMAAVSLAACVSGCHLNAAATARNKHPEYSSGMEARVAMEVGRLAARQRVTRAEANRIVKCLLSEYEDRIETAPLGKRFDECYHVDSVQPTREYLDLYDRCKEKMAGFGLDFGLL